MATATIKSGNNSKTQALSQRPIGQSARQGIAWTALGRVSSTLLHIGGGVVLARLLSPNDFGVVAMALVVVNFASPVRNFGFKQAFIQRKDVDAEHIAALFWLELVCQTTIWIVIVLVAPLAAAFFNSVVVMKILPILGLHMVIGAIGSAPGTVLQREIRFKHISIISFLEKVLMTVSAVVMAVTGFGVWALVYGRLIGRATYALGSWLGAKMTLRLGTSVRAVKDLWGFGIWVSVRNFANYAAENVDYLIIGRILGEAPLGFYQRSFNMMRMPQKKFSVGVNKVVFSTFSRLQGEHARVRRAFRKVIISTTLLLFPILTLMIIIAPALVPAVYGTKWAPSVLPLQIMCVAGLLRSTDPYISSLITARGCVKELARRRGIEAAMMSIGAVVGVHWGIAGVATAVTITSLLSVIYLLRLLKTTAEIDNRDYFGPQKPAAIASAVMAGGAVLTQVFLLRWPQLPAIVTLAITIVIAVVVYLAAVLAIRDTELAALLAELREHLKGVQAKIRNFSSQIRPVRQQTKTT